MEFTDMPEPEKGPVAQYWEGKWGPASVIGAIAFLFQVEALLITVGSVNSTVETLKSDVPELKHGFSSMAERMVRVETKIDMLLTSAPSKPAQR